MTFTKSFVIVVLGAVCVASTATRATAQAAPRDLTPYLIADRSAEIALARSAAPSVISDSAAVLVLTSRGFVPAVRGKNGFACLVLRGFSGSLRTPSQWWNAKIRAPLCLNPAAVRSVLPELEQRAALVMAGMPADDVVARSYRGYATHRLPQPESGAMAYMTSHGQYLSDADPAWMPHVMFFYGKGLTGAAWGAGDAAAPIIDGGVDPKTGIGIFLIPVLRWSDGTAFATR